jgi:centrosomal protein CEP170
VPVEYASTSEDEYGSNRHASRQGQARTFPSTRVAQLGGSAPATPSPGGGPGLRPHPQDVYMKDWTAHSEGAAEAAPAGGPQPSLSLVRKGKAVTING